MHPAWARSLRDQCQAAGVPFFFKQWGEWAPFATQAHYNGGIVLGGDCGGPGQISYHSDHRWSRRRIPAGFGVVRWKGDERGMLARIREEPTHRWGQDNGLSMTYLDVGKRAAGRLLDGRTWDEFPA